MSDDGPAPAGRSQNARAVVGIDSMNAYQDVKLEEARVPRSSKYVGIANKANQI
jgi:hypothetical protein